MELQFWAQTDVGRVREHNEDNFLVDKRLRLFVVCDGMGGHAAGEVASAMAVQIVREVISGHREVLDRLTAEPDNTTHRKAVIDLIEHSIREACFRIFESAQEDSKRRGMGTTCSLLLLHEGRGFIGHVGDSRIYLFRQDQVHQITEDHSLLNEMIRLGKIKPGEEKNLPHKNAVTRAVGVNQFVEVDTFELEVFEGDTFLLCSDGLSGYFRTDEMLTSLMTAEDLKESTQKSIVFANESGGKDNITTIMVRVAQSAVSTHDVQQKMDVLKGAPFFQYLSYREMVQIVGMAKRREVVPKERIFEAGQRNDTLLIVAEGSVTVFDGDVPIKELYPGDHFGDLSIIDDSMQELTLEANTAGVVLSIKRDRIMDLLRGEAELAVKILWNMLQTFAERARRLPPSVWHTGEVPVAELTPPSGTLKFDEDRRNPPALPPSVPEEVKLNIPSPDLVDPLEELRKTMPSTTLAELQQEALSNDETLDPDDPSTASPDDETLFEVERPTLKAAWEETEELVLERHAMPPRGSAGSDKTVPQMSRKEIAQKLAERTTDRPLGKGISGESVVRDPTPPKAQVMRRTKNQAGHHEEPKEKRKTTTVEIDLGDENIEEIT